MYESGQNGLNVWGRNNNKKNNSGRNNNNSREQKESLTVPELSRVLCTQFSRCKIRVVCLIWSLTILDERERNSFYTVENLLRTIINLRRKLRKDFFSSTHELTIHNNNKIYFFGYSVLEICVEGIYCLAHHYNDSRAQHNLHTYRP